MLLCLCFCVLQGRGRWILRLRERETRGREIENRKRELRWHILPKKKGKISEEKKEILKYEKTKKLIIHKCY